MRTYYAALEIKPADNERKAIGIVCLIHYNTRAKDGYIFGYKSMTEDMGPCEAECPIGILDLLTETTSEYALDWRARCRAFAMRHSNLPKLHDGDILIFDRPILFTDGTSHQRLIAVMDPTRPRQTRLRAPNGRHYRISRLKDRAFSVEKPQPG